MHKENVTIKDIARELEISPSTVSRALKDHPDISPETKKLVNTLADKWNYRPNPIALSLKGGNSHTVGIVVPEIIHYFFSSVISGIEDYANEHGYNVMICQSNEEYEKEVNSIQTLVNSRVDGILISLAKLSRNMEHFHQLKNRDIPIVFFDRISTEVESDRVVVDDAEGAYMATKHLILEGRKRIAHLSGPANLVISKDRIDGYIRALNEFQCNVTEENIVKCDQIQEAEWIVPSLMKRTPPPDAFFCVNDFTAAQTLKIVKKLGYRVPEDVAIVGFTNGQLSGLTDPGLTTVDQHGYDMGREAAHLLLDRIKDRSLPYRNRVIKTDLVVRGSSVAE
ncbi:MAG: LacI family DNA-binding transcriptional regulator [Bacteroidota bacterium]|nr:LacI family DNA-binding transcriptional regulator [Bacteroidota bacterium]